MAISRAICDEKLGMDRIDVSIKFPQFSQPDFADLLKLEPGDVLESVAVHKSNVGAPAGQYIAIMTLIVLRKS